MHPHDPTLRLGHPLKNARAAVILIHGRGSSAEDMVTLADALDLADVAVLAPSAPGGSWYPQRFLVPLAQNEPSLTRALQRIAGLVQEASTAGLTTDRIALIGFSQGACLALEHTAREGTRYGFTAGLSGALIGPLATPRPKRDLHGTPILLGCAEADAHIPFDYVEHSAAVLAGMNARVTKQVFPGGAHTVFPEEVTWLNQQLAQLRE